MSLQSADAPLAQVRHQVAAQGWTAKQRHVIALDGPSGSGKTTLAGHLAAMLTELGLATTIVHLDDHYPGWRGLEAGVDLMLDAVVRPYVAAADVVQAPTWDYRANQPGTTRTYQCGPVLMLDGVGSGAARCRPLLSLLIWSTAPADIRRCRALARDADTYPPMWDMWAKLEEQHYAHNQTAASADLRFSTEDDECELQTVRVPLSHHHSARGTR